MPVRITDSAIARFAQLRAKNPGHPRIEIRAGGCNGFEKHFSFTETVADDDLQVPTVDGPVIIDIMSYEMLDNATVDFKTDFAGSYFTIDIPEASSTCGCGTSFSL